jgi:hypothetical protein
VTPHTPPSTLAGATVVATAEVGGPPPVALAFARYDDDSDVHLFRCDADWRVVTGSVHESICAAIAQAVVEFGSIELRQ